MRKRDRKMAIRARERFEIQAGAAWIAEEALHTFIQMAEQRLFTLALIQFLLAIAQQPDA